MVNEFWLNTGIVKPRKIEWKQAGDIMYRTQKARLRVGTWL